MRGVDFDELFEDVVGELASRGVKGVLGEEEEERDGKKSEEF